MVLIYWCESVPLGGSFLQMVTASKATFGLQDAAHIAKLIEPFFFFGGNLCNLFGNSLTTKPVTTSAATSGNPLENHEYIHVLCHHILLQAQSPVNNFINSIFAYNLMASLQGNSVQLGRGLIISKGVGRPIVCLR